MSANGKFQPLPDAPKPWAMVRPRGLHIVNGGIRKATRDKLWKFFHPKTGTREGAVPGEGDFPWYQRFKRFPKTAHFNGWHSGQFLGDDGQQEFANKYPELHAAALEAITSIADAGEDLRDVPNWGNFQPESVAVMRHKPNWGLGNHYDNAHDPGVGMVLMLSISDDDAVPRIFKFTDPPRGRAFSVPTADSQVVVFGGECYDEWQHESVRNPKQSGETISMTIRLAAVCGHTGGGGQYKTGAPAALKVAHGRIRKKMAIAKLSKQCAKQACEGVVAKMVADVA